MSRATALLLNASHAIDHLFLLVFATAVAAIAADWSMLWLPLARRAEEREVAKV